MQAMINSPLFGLTLTLVAYVFATWLYQKTKFILFAPLITAVTLILVVLQLLAVPLETYRNGADIISLLLIPATASLAFSIYQQIKVLKAHLFPILLGTLVGSVVSVACIMALAHLFQLPQDLMVSLLPKSTTTAIAVELSESHGGILGVTMAAVLVTGVFGAMFAPLWIRIFRIHNRVAAGVAIGASSHGLGTAKALEIGELEGAMSGLAMGITGFFTVVVFLLALM